MFALAHDQRCERQRRQRFDRGLWVGRVDWGVWAGLLARIQARCALDAECGVRLARKGHPTVEWHGAPRDTRLEFTTGADATFDAAALSVAPSVSTRLTLAGDTHCCKDTLVTSCGSAPWCVYDDEWARAELKLSVTTPADSEGQYAYRVQWLGDGAELGTSEWAIARQLSFVYDESATEYCGRVSVKSLVDGVVSELGPFCVCRHLDRLGCPRTMG